MRWFDYLILFCSCPLLLYLIFTQVLFKDAAPPNIISTIIIMVLGSCSFVGMAGFIVHQFYQIKDKK